MLFTSYVPFDREGLGDGTDDSPLACSAAEGFGRVYAVRLGNGSPALPLPGKIEFQDEAEGTDEETDRFRLIGPGLQGDVVPYPG